MALSNDYPILDGIAPSWADISVKASANGAPLIEMKDIQSINTNTTVEVGEQRQAGRVIRRTTGSVSFEANIVLYRTGYQKLLRAAKALAPLRGQRRVISLVHFDIQVLHTPPDESDIYEYHLEGCRMLGRALNGAEGSDADTVDVPLSVVTIVDVVDGEEVIAL